MWYAAVGVGLLHSLACAVWLMRAKLLRGMGSDGALQGLRGKGAKRRLAVFCSHLPTWQFVFTPLRLDGGIARRYSQQAMQLPTERIRPHFGVGGQRKRAWAALLCALGLLLGCEEAGNDSDQSGKDTPGPATSRAPQRPPPPPVPQALPEPVCPPEMVRVRPQRATDGGGAVAPFCIDRYESMLVDAARGRIISPDYSPSRKWSLFAFKLWRSKRSKVGGPRARAMLLPPLPAWQRNTDFEPVAKAKKGVRPNGYTSGVLAEKSCRNAGKRLCTPEQWLVACRGEAAWPYPYGPEYEQGACNVFRYAHPAAILHDDASRGHTDPRLNRVRVRGKPLLRKTGGSKRCASRWGEDAVYDMVGNLDEWVHDPAGSFMGGFYSRATKSGCSWRARAHPMVYFDYSTGVRCCANLPAIGP